MDAFLRGLFGLNHHHHEQHQSPQRDADDRSRGPADQRRSVASPSAAPESGHPSAAAVSNPSFLSPADSKTNSRGIWAVVAFAEPVVVVNHAVASGAATAEDMEEASSWMLLEDDTGRKRGRDNSAADSAFGLEGSQRTDVDYSSGRMSGTRTPRLELDEDRHQRPVKRFRGERSVIPVSPLAHRKRRGKKTLLHGVDDEDDSVQVAPACPLKLLPDDLLANCLSYLGGVEDRFALQSTSTQFRALSNSDPMRQYIPVGGDKQTGLHGIIQESDTPETAARSLEPYVKAGNLEAIYMLGIIKSYCHQDVEAGIQLLKFASSMGYTRASYALGLALRDCQPEEANKYMKDAADRGYIPALQEVLPSRKMKALHGEPKADELRLHLDPLCLNRLLSRYYVQSARLREANTSHCWNPLCGRWAFKANSGGASSVRGMPSSDAEGLTSIALTERAESFPSAAAVLSAAASSLLGCSSCKSPPSPRDTVRVSRMKMCSRCCRAKYCSKLCQVYDWRSGRHKMECQFL